MVSVVGYVGNAAYLCPDCTTEEQQDEETGLPPVFSTDEYVGVYRPTCDSCGKVIHMSFYQQCEQCEGDLKRVQCPSCLEDLYACKKCGHIQEVR